jgi:protein-S-isoprenylcysteine O-methyltransferase Ste14
LGEGKEIIMPILQILIALILIGAVLYIVSLLPIDPTIKRIIQVVAIVFICIWILSAMWPMIGSFGGPPMRR